MVPCLREPPVRFLWCCCSLLIFILLLYLLFIFNLHFAVVSLFVDVLHFVVVVFYSQFLFDCRECYVLEGHFLPTGVFYLMLLYQHFNLRLSRFPWEPAVLPWSLHGFMLILETQTRPICLLDLQKSTNVIFRTIQF